MTLEDTRNGGGKEEMHLRELMFLIKCVAA